MILPRSLLLLLTLTCSGLLVLVSAQSLDLTVYERNGNSITLSCVHSENGSLVSNPAFFRDGTFFELLNRQIVQNGVLFAITRSIEGVFRCGLTASASPTQRSQELSLVALPSGTNVIPVNPRLEFEFMTGDTARIDCAIPPGALTSQYYVTWRSAASPGMAFYETFPPHLSFPDFSFSDRYSIDDQTFSLVINEVTPGDMRFTYQCLLGVENPQESTRLDYTYVFAAIFNLTLSILELPKFINPPEDQVAVRGDNVNFTCSVLSSPDPSSIQWLYKGQIVDPSLIKSLPNSNQEEGGVVTTSVLTISNVDGFDSGTVRCQVIYITSEAPFMDAREAELSVLDVTEFQTVTLQDGGFILQARPKRPLPVPVALRLTYTDTTDSSNSVTRTSPTQYFNVREINDVFPITDVPQFSTFNLSVAMVAERLVGPFNSSSEVVHRRPPPEGFELGSIVTFVLLGVLILLILLLIIIVLARYCKLPEKQKDLFKKNIRLLWSFLRGKCDGCNRCRRKHGDSIVSDNGFNNESAEVYVDTLRALIEFGQDDSVIRPLLDKTDLLISPEARLKEIKGLTKPSDPEAQKRNGDTPVHFDIQQAENPK